MTEYEEPDDGCYWKLIPLDDWGEAMAELDTLQICQRISFLRLCVHH